MRQQQGWAGRASGREKVVLWPLALVPSLRPPLSLPPSGRLHNRHAPHPLTYQLLTPHALRPTRSLYVSMTRMQLVALASCLIPVEKSTETIKLTTQLAEPLAQLQVGARVCARRHVREFVGPGYLLVACAAA